MAVKILHAADLHLDSPFEALPPEKATIRRREQRDLLDDIVTLAETEQAQLVLLAGDLLDSSLSYYETHEVLLRAFEKLRAAVFIAPGNHDYYSHKSPYAFLKFPENVHIFKTPQVSAVTLPQLGCRVFGAAFTGQISPPLLTGFQAPDDGLLNIMVLHGDMTGRDYNPLREKDVADTHLDYLALGHIHTYSGIQKACQTTFAYPGCPEGRGFDETGDKGVIVGSISKEAISLSFKPLHGRRYRTLTLDLTGATDPLSAAAEALPPDTARDIYRLIFTGEYDSGISTDQLQAALSHRFFHLTLQDRTAPPKDLWSGLLDESLRGSFLRGMKARYDCAEDSAKATVLLAVRYGLAALMGGEEAV